MVDEPRKTVWDHLVAIGRDVLVVVAVITMFASIIMAITRPYWLPFATLPVSMVDVQRQLSVLQTSINTRLRPRLLEFQGMGLIVGPKRIKAGDQITVLYHLRRDATCDADVDRTFYDVDRGTSIITDTFMAIKAPVTEDFIPFKLDIFVPPSVKPGRYAYRPTITPIDCGVYGEMVAPPSEIFEVTE